MTRAAAIVHLHAALTDIVNALEPGCGLLDTREATVLYAIGLAEAALMRTKDVEDDASAEVSHAA